MEGWGSILQKTVYALNHPPIYGTVSSIVRIHRSKNHRVEKRVLPLTFTPISPLEKKFTSISQKPQFLLDWKFWFQSGQHSCHNKYYTELEATIFSWPLWASDALNSAKKGGRMLGGVIGPDYQKEVGLLLHIGSN